MSNRRFIILFLLGIVCQIAALVLLTCRSREVASSATRSTLCEWRAESIATIGISRLGTNIVTLMRGGEGTNAVVRNGKQAWYITSPFVAPADESTVSRLVDALTMTPFGDILSENELSRLGMSSWSMGLVDKARVALSMVSRNGETNVVLLGESSASDVVAQVKGLKNVFSMPASVLTAVPKDADGFQRRSLVTMSREQVAGIDLRSPGSPFVKLVRDDGGWNLSEPASAHADAAAVAKLVDGIVQAKIVGFVQPSVANHPDVTGAEIKGDLLVPYELSEDKGQAVAVRTANGATEQIVFGKGDGTNLVFALVWNRTAIVMLEAKVADLCRASGASFRDMRIFPLAEKERIESISLTAGKSVYALVRNANDTNDVWRLETPVAAPADAKVAAAFVDVVLRLRRSDVPEVAPEHDAVVVSITTDRGSRTGVTVPKKLFASCGSFADLRSKTLLALDPKSVRRITVSVEKRQVAVVRDNPLAIWCLDQSVGGKPADVNAEAVKTLLAAITQIEAESVETVVAMPADKSRCGLETPWVTVAVDFFGAGKDRCNLLVGGSVAKGGNYATMGGSEAIFVLPRSTMQVLVAPLTK